MTRDQIIDLIRESYDPVPRHWRASEASNWDDGTGDIADKILASFHTAQQVPGVMDAIKREIERWSSDERVHYPDCEVIESLERIHAAALSASPQQGQPAIADALRKSLFALVPTFHFYEDGRPPLPIEYVEPDAADISRRFDEFFADPPPSQEEGD